MAYRPPTKAGIRNIETKYCTRRTRRGIVCGIVQPSWLSLSLQGLRSQSTETHDGVELWFAELATFGSLLSSSDDIDVLSSVERDRGAAMSAADVRRDFLVSRILLRHILGARLGIDPRQLEFAISEHGKPSLRVEGSQSPLYFNVSHSRGAWLLAVTRCGELGVDLETRRYVDNSSRLAARVFSAAERLELAVAADAHAAFLNCWTRKEAVLKAIGSGFTSPAREIDVGTETTYRRIASSTIPQQIVELRTLQLPIMGYAAIALLATESTENEIYLTEQSMRRRHLVP